MLGAILGDIVGSPYEFVHNNYKHKDFPLLSEKSHFTDDTVMAVAVARGLIAGKGIPERTFEETKSEMRIWGETYPHAGYGGMFRRWLHTENPNPYGSFGNGSAMRVSAAGWLFDTLDKTLRLQTSKNRLIDSLTKMEDRLFLNPLSRRKNIPKVEKLPDKNPMERAGFDL